MHIPYKAISRTFNTSIIFISSRLLKDLAYTGFFYKKSVYKKPSTRHPKIKVLELQGKSYEPLEISVPSPTVSETHFSSMDLKLSTAVCLMCLKSQLALWGLQCTRCYGSHL